MEAIVVSNLVKDYGPARAVDDVSFTVRAGEIFALLGPNGAGKTTAVEILEGHRHRTAGSVRVLGFDPATGGRAYRERIGIVLQSAGLEEDFTVHELVALYRGLYPRRLDVDDVIDLVGLSEKRKAKAKTLSGGQARRLDLALGLVGDPDVLFLDEPTTGFDPSARHKAWQLVWALRDLGKTVLLTTHYLDEAEHLADRVGILKAGRLVAVGAPADIGGTARKVATLSFRLPDAVDAVDFPVPATAGVSRTGPVWRITTTHVTGVLHGLTAWADRRHVELLDLTVTRPTLEDVYLQLVDADAGPRTPAAVAV